MTRSKTGYGTQTIGSLIQLLKNTVEENRYLSMDSPVMISDYAMSGFKYEFDVLPNYSPLNHTAGVCLFHSLGEEIKEPLEEDVKVKIPIEIEEETEEETEEDTSIMKFVNWFKN